MDARAGLEISTYLCAIADDLFHLRGNDPIAVDTARKLRQLARRNLIALPGVDPQRDDLRHWMDIDDQQLRSEIHADAWNLAAGITVSRDRTMITEARRGAS